MGDEIAARKAQTPILLGRKEKGPQNYLKSSKLGYKDSNLEMTESESVAVGNASSVFISVPGLFISECYH